MEHPYFVMGHGWASCNPERTEHCYGLKVHKLQVGDILISLTPRESAPSPVSSRTGSTIMTTATTTSMTARLSVNSVSKPVISVPAAAVSGMFGILIYKSYFIRSILNVKCIYCMVASINQNTNKKISV